MRSRIPLRHRLHLLAVYARLVLLYNAAIGLLGAAALLTLRRAGLLEGLVNAGAGLAVDGLARVGLTVAGLVMMTAGHWLAVVVFGLVHRNEYALFRAGGWGPAGLHRASWGLSIVAGLALIALGGLLGGSA